MTGQEESHHLLQTTRQEQVEWMLRFPFRTSFLHHTLQNASAVFFPSAMKRTAPTNSKQRFKRCICQVSTLQVCLAQGRTILEQQCWKGEINPNVRAKCRVTKHTQTRRTGNQDVGKENLATPSFRWKRPRCPLTSAGLWILMSSDVCWWCLHHPSPLLLPLQALLPAEGEAAEVRRRWGKIQVRRVKWLIIWVIKMVKKILLNGYLFKMVWASKMVKKIHFIF